VFLMDLGDATFTSFEGGEDWIKFYEKFPQVDPIENPTSHPWYVGKVHSHVGMQVFHSGTDTQDIVDSAPKFPFFLSLVVNYKCNAFAEIGVSGEVEVEETRTLRNIILKNPKTKKKTNYTYIIPCDVYYDADSWLLDQIKALKAKPAPTTVWSGMGGTTTTPKSYISTYQEPKQIGFKMPQPSISQNPKGYKKVLDKLTDLFMLGTGTKQSDATPPSIVYKYIDSLLTPTDLEDYGKAFKYYYLQFWAIDNFGLYQEDEETLNCIEHFVKQEPNSAKWLTTSIKRYINELRKETTALRTV